MDRPFSPDARPRAAPEPLPSFQDQDPPSHVAAVQPVNGQASDADSLAGREEEAEDSSRSNRAGALRETFNPAALISEAASGGGGDDREENGRPSSAPARTPNSAEHLPAYTAATAASLPRPRNVRPLISVIGEVEAEMPSLEPVLIPAPRHDPSTSSDGGAESSGEQGESLLQQYSELSPGPSGERRYVCHFCSFSSDTALPMRDHMMSHGNDSKMKCLSCGYSSEEKTQLRRHTRRQHPRPAPTSMLHCDKCQFSTPAPRRMREHYSFQHNEELSHGAFPTNGGSSVLTMRSSATSSSSSSFGSSNTTPAFNRLAYDAGFYAVNLSGRGMSAYRLPQPRGGATLQFEPSAAPSSTIVSGGGFAQPVGFPAFRSHAERRPFPVNQSPLGELTLEYLFGHPRAAPASSTITSCEYPARPSNPHRPDLNNFSPLRGSTPVSREPLFAAAARQTPTSPHRSRCGSSSMQEGEATVKIKTEPMDCDGVSDVSSSGVPGLFDRGGGVDPEPRSHRGGGRPETTSSSSTPHHPRFRRPLFEATSPPHSRAPLEQSDEIATSGGGGGGGDASLVSQSSEAASSRMDAGSAGDEDSEPEERRAGGGPVVVEGDSLGQHLLFSIKAETSSVAVQCSSAMKAEALPLVTVAAAEHSTTESQPAHRTAERGVQCEILSPPAGQRRLAARALSSDSDQHSVSGSDAAGGRCPHCGIAFEDEVMFSIHLGCHSHTDPFVCNVCGKKCHSKYGFYSHIMRGHHL